MKLANIVLLIGFVVTTVVAQEYIGSAGQNMTIVRGPSGKIGYEKDSKVVVPYRFDWAGEFNDEGYAVVEIGDKYGIIDKSGKTIVPIEFDYAFNVENGMGVVYREEKFGAIDLTGKLVVPFEYEFLGSFDPLGYAPATKWGQSGIINKRNDVIVQFDYLSALSKDGYSRVLDATGFKNFDPSGKEAFVGYESVTAVKGGYVVANKPNGATGLFTASGISILPEEYRRIEVANNGRTAILEKDNRKGLYDLKTKAWLIPLENEHLTLEGENLVSVWKTDENGPAYVTDLSGRRISRVDYLEVHSLGDLGFKVNQGNKWGVIDRAGNTILPAEFEDIRFVRGGTLIAARRSADASCRQCGWGLTDLKGRTILPFQYGKPDRNHFSKTFDWDKKNSPFDFDSGSGKEFAQVMDLQTMKPGIVDNDGNWVLQCGTPYDDFTFDFRRRKSDDGNMLPVKKGGKWGVYDLTARREVIPPTITLGDFDAPNDLGNFAMFLDPGRKAWGIFVYETGQVFKPGTFSYDYYDSGSKLLTVSKGGKSESFSNEISSPQKLALQMVSGDDGELKGLMRLDGSMVTKIEYSKFAYNRELPGYWAVRNGKGGWLNVAGSPIIPFKFDLSISGEAGELFGAIMDQQFFDAGGTVDVIYNGKVVLIDRKGNVVKATTDFGVPPSSSIRMGDLGKAKYYYTFKERNEKYNRKFLIDGRLYEGEPTTFLDLPIKYNEGLALLQRDGFFGYIDRSGKEVIPFIYQKASGFSGGFARVHTDKDVFLINRDGKRLYSHGGIVTLLSRKERGLPLALNSELVRTMEVNEAKLAFDQGALMVDTRSAEGFGGEHIKGAINITKATLEANIAQLPKNKKIVTYCSCPREESSGTVAYELKKRGYTEVYALRGGTTAWKNAGFPMEK